MDLKNMSMSVIKNKTKQQIMGNGNNRGFRWWLDIKWTIDRVFPTMDKHGQAKLHRSSQQTARPSSGGSNIGYKSTYKKKT